MANKLSADSLVDAIDEVIESPDAVYNDEGTRLYGRAAEQWLARGQRTTPISVHERNEAARQAAAASQAIENGEAGIETTVIAAPGVVIDKFSGKTWTLPSDAMADLGPLLHRSPYDIKKDPEFMYEFHNVSELSEMMAQDFVPVTRRELNMDDLTLNPSQPSPLDSYYVVGGTDVAMKIPRLLGERRLAALKQYCDAARDGVKRARITDAKGSTQNLPLNDQNVPVSGNVNIRTEVGREPSRDEIV